MSSYSEGREIEYTDERKSGIILLGGIGIVRTGVTGPVTEPEDRGAL